MNWKWVKSSVSGNFVKAERPKGSHSSQHNETLKAFGMNILKQTNLTQDEKYMKLKEKYMKLEAEWQNGLPF